MISCVKVMSFMYMYQYEMLIIFIALSLFPTTSCHEFVFYSFPYGAFLGLKTYFESFYLCRSEMPTTTLIGC